MTDRDPPAVPTGVPDVDPLDELASAIVDGEATPAELARASEPDVAARVERLRAVASLVATPVAPVGDAAREAVLAAVLAAPAESEEPALSTDEAVVVPLSSARRRSPAWLPAVAAAVLVVLGLGVVVVATGDNDSGTDTATASLETVEEDAGGDAAVAAPPPAPGEAADQVFADSTMATTIPPAAGAAGGGSSAGAAGSAAPAVAIVDLGGFETADGLAVAIRDRGAARDSAAGTDDDAAAESGAAVGDVPCTDSFEPGVVEVATARLDGVDVVVGVFDDRYEALDASSCELVASGDL